VAPASALYKIPNRIGRPLCLENPRPKGGMLGIMDDLDSEWQRKGATLSDKTTWDEFGLTQDEIVRAIRAGKLHYREGSMYGNPWLRLLRREVEALVTKNHGGHYLKDLQAKTELAHINRELKRLKNQMAALEERKSKLVAGSGKLPRSQNSDNAPTRDQTIIAAQRSLPRPKRSGQK
jgi:hypothetical protein